MKERLFSFLRGLKTFFMRIKNLFKVYGIVKENTYYPEIHRKSFLKRYFENIVWTLKYGELNAFYNLYGFDVELDKDIKSYMNYLEFMRDRNKMNGLDNTYNHIVILRDKLIFDKYMNSNDIKTAKLIAIIMNGEILDIKFEKYHNIENLFQKTVFIKNIDGECANGVYCIKSYEDYKKMEQTFKSGNYIIQEKLIQDEKMNALYSGSVNTIRIVTVRENKEIKILSSGLRVGTTRSKNVDNWAAGGLYIEINNDGKLTKYGFAKPIYGGKLEVHPDTKIKFEGYQIPKYEEVVSLVKRAHNTLYGIHSIGWDVAITSDGPVLIEGNDNWEISLMQANHGLRNAWKQSLK